ncbi:MAG: hypothetical protein IH624_00920 [Phycisphaerae bacterium]|nr:hypothetical protein [Phycisphaerae bacterium]
MVNGEAPIHDLAGWRLDENYDGVQGGNYVRSFDSAAEFLIADLNQDSMALTWPSPAPSICTTLQLWRGSS